MSCESCRADLPVGAKFCMECGTPAPAGAPAHELRKTVTLLFTDVTGSTALGEQLDPEAYRGVMGRYFAVARDAVERHGGTVEKFVGDAVLAVFGIPDVREDDALRAVRAAHELTRAIRRLSVELEASMGVRLEVRTGVNTGAVVAGSARAGGSFATGDAVNTAARLEQAAPPGEVLIGTDTWVLVRDAVEVEEVDPISAKGKAAPVAAYRLLDVHEGAEHGRRRREDTLLVGRDRETRVLVDALERTLETGRGHLVTVVGAPGIGKSRLVTHFLDQVGDRAAVLTGRCVSYGQGITFWPVVQLLRQAVGLAGDESDEVTRHALLGLMDGTEDAEEVVGLLLPMLGKAGEPGGSEHTFWAVRRALEQLAARRPVVVAVEDLHWAEATLLDLLARVRDEVRDLPLLLVCNARPELLDEHPGWGAGSLNSTTFGLEPFSGQQTSDSLAALLGGSVDPAAARTIAAWAGGNPLFVEEVAAHLVERGLLRAGPDGWRLTGELSEAQVPPTVAALLAARLDRLPEPELRFVERLSIAGLELTAEDAAFLADGLQEPAEVAPALAALVHRDLLHRRRTEAGEVWAFRHLLVRDAAYESLPKALRAELHERFAERIEALGDSVGPEHRAFAAHHLEQALRFRNELAPHDPGVAALARRAVDVLVGAAEDARDREDLGAADGLLRRALDLGPTGSRRRELLVALAQVCADEERIDDLVAAVEELESATGADAGDLDRLGLRLLRGLADLSRSMPVDPEELARLATECAARARDAGHTRWLLLSLMVHANCGMMRARWAEVRAVFDEMASVGRPQDRRWARLFSGAVILYGDGPLSEFDRVADALAAQGGHSPTDEDQLRLLRLAQRCVAGGPGCAEAIEAEERRGDTALPPIFRLTYLVIASLFAGDTDRAARNLRAVVDVMVDAGDLSHASTMLPWLGLVRTELEEPRVDEVEALVEQGAGVTSPHDVLSVALVAAGRGAVASLRGDHERGRVLFEEAVRVVDDSDQVWQQADVRRWAAAAAARRGDTGEWRRLLTEALERYRHKGLTGLADRVEAQLRAAG